MRGDEPLGNRDGQHRPGRAELRGRRAYERSLLPVPGAANTKNVPNLTAGSLDHYHVLINSQNFWQSGQSSTSQSFTMGSPSTVCSSLDEDGKRGPFVDVKVTQDSVPLFLPLLGIRPTITAHARVSLEQGTSENEYSSARGPRRLGHALRQRQLPQRQRRTP